MPQDEIEAKAARNIATRARARAEVTRIKLQATDAASATAIATAETAKKRAKDEDDAAQQEVARANMVAEQRDAVVRKRQKREDENAGGINGILGRHYASQDQAAMRPEHYAGTVNDVNAALRRMVG